MNPFNSLKLSLTREAWIVALVVFVFHLILVGFYVYPSYALRDSPMFTMVAASGGITHPPGSPTWALLATIGSRMIPFGGWALRTNLFCGFLGAITLAGLYLNAWLLIRKLWPSIQSRIVSSTALVAPLTLNLSQGWWVQCTTTEQYTLMTAFLAIIGLVGWSLDTPKKELWKYLLLGVLWGLTTGNHLSQLALGPFILALCLIGMSRDNLLTIFYRGISAGLGFLLGISVYLWVFVRSLSNPLVDNGNVKSWDQFIWLISREQYESRSLEEIPYGFAWEWIKSYNFFGELGVGFILALVGLVIVSKRSWRLIVLWLLLVIPYGVGMLEAHRKQSGMKIDYIDVYGVYDWHVALYFWLALLAAPALTFAWERLSSRHNLLSSTTIAIVLVLLTGGGILSGYSRSRHNSANPRAYTAALLDPVPENALMLLSTDNTAFPVGYEITLEGKRKDLALIWASPSLPVYIANNMDESSTGTLSQDILRSYLIERGLDPNNTPLRYPTPGLEDMLGRTVICDYTVPVSKSAPWLLPRGFLFEYSGNIYTDEDVRNAHDRWEEDFLPNLPEPDALSNDQDRRGWSEHYERRALYFFVRGMYDLAQEDFQMAIEWMPERARLYNNLGISMEYQGMVEEAQHAYLRAYEIQPLTPGPRFYLALAEARAGNFQSALDLLEEEERLSPNDDKIPGFKAKLLRDIEARRK